jgi:hypothetical protein
LLILAAAAFAAFLAEPAQARQGRGRDDLVAGATSSVAGSALSVRLREKSHGRWEFRMQLENAPSGLAPKVWIADATGTLVPAGDLVPDDTDVGEYKLRLRSQKGGTLPVGAASLSELGGRAYEVRENGAAIFSGSLPSIAAKRSVGGGSGRGGADDPATHDAGDDRGGRGPGKRGADDAAGDVRRGRGADDAAGHR